jgi:hypothetical protein
MGRVRWVPLLLLIAAGTCLGPTAAARVHHYGFSVTVSGPGQVVGKGDDGEINCPPDCTTSVAGNGGMTLRAVPNPGAVFGGWGGGCSGTNVACDIGPGPPNPVSASFNAAPPPPPPKFPVTVARQGTGTGYVGGSGGIDCGPTCSVQVGQGIQIQLVAVSDRGSKFTGWGGACSGTGPCNLTITAAAAVTATFSKLAPPAVVVLPGSGTRGRTTELRYRIRDLEGTSRALAMVVLRHKVVAKIAEPEARVHSGVSQARWYVPTRLPAGLYRLGVVARDPASGEGGFGCARLRIT